MTEADRRRQRRLIAMLIGLTILTFGGPLGFGMVLSGGENPGWPPDRTVEWVYLLANAGLIVALMAVILVAGLRGLRATPRPAPPAPTEERA